MDDLKAFRRWGNRTLGHPENFETAGVEVTTGLTLEHLKLVYPLVLFYWKKNYVC
jgi:hypothetical protein